MSEPALKKGDRVVDDLGRVGRVVRVDKAGRLVVAFQDPDGGETWAFGAAPSDLERVPAPARGT